MSETGMLRLLSWFGIGLTRRRADVRGVCLVHTTASETVNAKLRSVEEDKIRGLRAAEFGAWTDTIRVFGTRILGEGWGADFGGRAVLFYWIGGPFRIRGGVGDVWGVRCC